MPMSYKNSEITLPYGSEGVFSNLTIALKRLRTGDLKVLYSVIPSPLPGIKDSAQLDIRIYSYLINFIQYKYKYAPTGKVKSCSVAGSLLRRRSGSVFNPPV